MKKLLSLALSSVILLSLTACGGASSNSDLSVLDKIKETGKLTMMTATGFPPYEYIGDDGYPAGVDIDLAELVAIELGVEFEVLDMDFGLLIESLKSGKGDIVAAGMCITEARAEQIDFTIAYGNGGQSIVLRSGDEFNSIDDLYNMKVGVQESTVNHIYVTEELGITPLAYKNAVFCAEALLSNKIDCIVIDEIPGKLLSASYNNIECITGLFDDDLKLGMGIKKGETDFVQLVNSVIEKAVSDGTLDALVNKHIDVVVAQQAE